MAKENKKVTDVILDEVSGGRDISFGKWSFDVKCPFCGKDDMLRQGLQMYSEQSGMTVVWCDRCQDAFSINDRGQYGHVEVRKE